VKGRATARLASVDDDSADLIGPPSRQHRGTRHVGSLSADRLVASDDQLVYESVLESGGGESSVENQGGEIDGVPSGQDSVGDRERRTDGGSESDGHGESLLQCLVEREILIVHNILAAEYLAGPDELSLGLLVLRVAVGLTMAAHGYVKYFKGGRIAGTGRWFDSMGMRPGKVHAHLAASTEIGSGLLLALGLFTPLAGLAMVAVMFVAAYTVHLKNGFFSVSDGYEYNFVLSIVAIALATTGPGKYSLDYKLELIEDFDGWTGLLIAAVGGVGAAVGQLALFYRPPASSE